MRKYCLFILTLLTWVSLLKTTSADDKNSSCVQALVDSRSWDDSLIAAVRGHFVDKDDVLNIKEILKLNYNGDTVYKQKLLIYAARNGNVTVANILKDDPDIKDINIQDEHGFTAFHTAVFRGQNGLVRQMLKWPEVDINKANNNGMTPLMTAIDKSPFLALDIMKHSELKVNAQSSAYKATALHYAVAINSVMLVRNLVKIPGIDVSIKDINDEDAFQLAEYRGFLEVKEVLYGASAENIQRSWRANPVVQDLKNTFNNLSKRFKKSDQARFKKNDRFFIN